MLAEPIAISGKTIDPPAQTRLPAGKGTPQGSKDGVKTEKGLDLSGMTELLAKVQKKLGCKRTSLSSLSEASRLFDASLLKEVIEELGKQAGPVGRDARLSEINQTITLVDGSIVSALPSLIQASILKQTEGSGLVQCDYTLTSKWIATPPREST